jgi:hypothetical protein
VFKRIEFRMRLTNRITRRGHRERGEIEDNREVLVGLSLLKERNVWRFSHRSGIAGMWSQQTQFRSFCTGTATP